MNQIELLSNRLKLNLIDRVDLEAIHQLHSLPETDEFNALGIPKDIAETKSVIKPWIAAHQAQVVKNYTFSIRLQQDDQFIGLFGLKIGSEKYKIGEVWYKIHLSYWGKGYATEALNRILDFGFGSLKLHRMEAGCAVQNVGSIKVLEKVGMIREGQKRKVLPLRSGWSDNYQYAILETDERKE